MVITVRKSSILRHGIAIVHIRIIKFTERCDVKMGVSLGVSLYKGVVRVSYSVIFSIV